MTSKHEVQPSSNEDQDVETKIIDTDVEATAVDELEISPADDKRVQRKVDRVVMSLAAAVYFMQYLDKRGLAFAAIFGMREDLNLQGQEYS
jgi:ACS family allantoate permease-like MFS transporter